mgnify:FL=1
MMDLLSFVLGNRQKGFTLIETALAMLAIGLGLLAIFGLGRLGLQTAKETEYDQRCAMMADAIFETLRDYNARFVEEARTSNVTNLWTIRWEQVRQEDIKLPFPPIAGMRSGTNPSIPLRFTEDDVLFTTFNENSLSLTDWNPFYRLSSAFFADPSLPHGMTNGLHITLTIYPDSYTYSSDQRVFHTFLANPGGLP